MHAQTARAGRSRSKAAGVLAGGALLFAGCAPCAWAGTVTGGCRATLSLNEARQLALSIPNARAFAENHGATLAAEPDAQVRGGTVNFRITAKGAAATDSPTEVGVYTVNLRTGTVLDDDQEPAGDAATEALWQQLRRSHCQSR